MVVAQRLFMNALKNNEMASDSDSDSGSDNEDSVYKYLDDEIDLKLPSSTVFAILRNIPHHYKLFRSLLCKLSPNIRPRSKTVPAIPTLAPKSVKLKTSASPTSKIKSKTLPVSVKKPAPIPSVQKVVARKENYPCKAVNHTWPGPEKQNDNKEPNDYFMTQKDEKEYKTIQHMEDQLSCNQFQYDLNVFRLHDYESLNKYCRWCLSQLPVNGSTKKQKTIHQEMNHIIRNRDNLIYAIQLQQRDLQRQRERITRAYMNIDQRRTQEIQKAVFQMNMEKHDFLLEPT